MLHRALIIAFIMLFSACGFHLKGESQLPVQLQILQLIKSNDADFNQILIRQLKSSSVTIVEDSQAVLLKVEYQALPELTLAKSSSSGLEIKQLKVRMTYSVKNKDGVWLVEQKQLEQTLDFEADSDQILAKNNEKQQLYRQMKQYLVRVLMYQLQLLS